MKQMIEMDLRFMPVIDKPPVSGKQLYGNACQNDQITVESWRDIWIKNYKANFAKFGSFRNNSVAKLFQEMKFKPCIVAGSGPSLKNNITELKRAKEAGFGLVSCLHNMSYFMDNGIEPDCYLTLDAGEIVIKDAVEAGKELDKTVYWEKTKALKLAAFVSTDPKLFDHWKGEVLWFNSLIPDAKVQSEFNSTDPFRNVYFATGGCALGGSMYLAKAIYGACPIIFVGADFAFGYDKRFHSWASGYDVTGRSMPVIDIYGNRVETWPSYNGFKNYLDYIFLRSESVMRGTEKRLPGIYINASESGTLGAYYEGCMSQIMQRKLSEVIDDFVMSDNYKAAKVVDQNGQAVMEDGKQKTVNILDDPDTNTLFVMY